MYKNMSIIKRRVTEDDMTSFINGFDLKITGFSKWGDSPHRKINNFIISEYEIVYIYKGKLKLTTPKSEYMCEKGSLVLLEPFTAYSAERLELKDMIFYNIFFDIYPEYKRNTLLGAILGGGESVFHKNEICSFDSLLSKLYEDSILEKAGMLACVKSSLILILIEMMRVRNNNLNISQEIKGNKNKELYIVNEAIKFISKNIEKPIKVTDICKELIISENYLYKAFINVLDIAPSKYIMQYKVKRSEELLKLSSYSVGEISQMLGFSSLYHFSRTFKTYLGVSPTSYIKRLYLHPQD